jgi:hypothetical protein
VSKTGPASDARSRGRDRIPPLARRLGSEDPERRARDEMALKIEGVVARSAGTLGARNYRCGVSSRRDRIARSGRQLYRRRRGVYPALVAQTADRCNTASHCGTGPQAGDCRRRADARTLCRMSHRSAVRLTNGGAAQALPNHRTRWRVPQLVSRLSSWAYPIPTAGPSEPGKTGIRTPLSIDSARPNGLVRSEAVAMDDLAVEEIRHRREADMRLHARASG